MENNGDESKDVEKQNDDRKVMIKAGQKYSILKTHIILIYTQTHCIGQNLVITRAKSTIHFR